MVLKFRLDKDEDTLVLDGSGIIGYIAKRNNCFYFSSINCGLDLDETKQLLKKLEEQ